MSDKETSKHDEDLEIGDMKINRLDLFDEIDFITRGKDRTLTQSVSTEEAKEIIKFLQHQIDKTK